MRAQLGRIRAISRKEFFHIIHDPRSLIIIFLLPSIQLIMFGYALNLEIQHVPLAVADYSNTPLSRHLIQQFEGSPFFEVFPYREPLNAAEELFLKREVRALLIIPPDFDRQVMRWPNTPVQILIDAADPNAAVNIKNYCNLVLADFNQAQNVQLRLPFDMQSTILYNPDMKSSYFFVPGLLALLLVMISALMTSITITREKETGTLEQILVSPTSAREIILGKVLPYIFLAFLVGTLILGIGIFLFQVPFKGSLLLLMLLATIYIVTALSLGLMISTIAPTQQVAMMVTLVVTLLPTIILSGFIFPIRSMPIILQWLSYLIPAKYFLVIVRGVMLKGNNLYELLTPTLFLMGMSLILLIFATKRFRLNLEK